VVNIALYGRSGSGKSTVAEILVRDYGFIHCKTGAACRRLCRELFGSEDKGLMNQVSDALRALDPAVWLRAAMSEVRTGNDAPLVFDSMRFQPDYAFLRDRGFITLQLVASPEQRVDRLHARGQPFDLLTDDLHAAEIELAALAFDHSIDNKQGVAELEAEVAGLARELGL
jgi:dephospho-CoA kinase